MRAKNEVTNSRIGSCLKVAVSLVEICLAVMWKGDFVNDKTEYFADFPSKMLKI